MAERTACQIFTGLMACNTARSQEVVKELMRLLYCIERDLAAGIVSDPAFAQQFHNALGQLVDNHLALQHKGQPPPPAPLDEPARDEPARDELAHDEQPAPARAINPFLFDPKHDCSPAYDRLATAQATLSPNIPPSDFMMKAAMQYIPPAEVPRAAQAENVAPGAASVAASPSDFFARTPSRVDMPELRLPPSSMSGFAVPPSPLRSDEHSPLRSHSPLKRSDNSPLKRSYNSPLKRLKSETESPLTARKRPCADRLAAF